MYQFSFLPYYPSSNVNFTINRLHLFNFWHYKDTHIADQEVRQKCEQICRLYVDTNLSVLEEMTLAVIDKNYSFTPLTDEQTKDIQRYADALSFCSVTHNQVNRAYTSDNFLLFHQNFNLTEDAIVYTTGSYVTLRNWQPFETTKLIKPSYIQNSIYDYRFDDTLFQAFANLIDDHNPENDYLFRVLEWFRFAYMNVEGFSYQNRIVLLVTAYEVFFQLPRNGKAVTFAKGIENLLEVDQMQVRDQNHKPIQTGLPLTQKLDASGKPKLDGSGKPKEYTMYGWWAIDVYDLRSKIVHGSEIKREDLVNHNDVEHFKIGVRMLEFCFYRLLEKKGYLTYKQASPEVQALFPNFNFKKHAKENDLREIEELIK